MTQLLGLVKDSLGNPVEGYLTIKLNAPMIEGSSSPIGVRYTKPGTYLITGGNFANAKNEDGSALTGGINLLPTREPTYTFSYAYDQTELVHYLNDQLYTGLFHLHTDQKYYTGEFHTAASQLLTTFQRKTRVSLVEPFNAGIPTGSTIEWAQLQHSSINTSNIDSSAYYIAELVAKQHASSISVNLAKPSGSYNPATQYQKFDVVFNPNDNAMYWYIADAPSAGIALTDTTKWMKIGQATSGGGGGSGISPADVLLNTDFAASWATESGKAPTAAKLFVQLNKYAPLAGSPTFPDGLKVPTQAKGSSDTFAASTEFVQQALTGISVPSPTTAPDLANLNVNGNEIVNARSLKKLSVLWTALTEEQPAGTRGGQAQPGMNTRILTNYGGSAAAESVIKPFGGTFFTLYPNSKYWIEAEACCVGAGRTRLLLCQNNSPTFTTLIKGRSDNTGFNGYQISVLPNYWTRLEGYVETGSTEMQCVLRQFFETTGAPEDKGKPVNSGGPEVYAIVTIYKMA